MGLGGDGDIASTEIYPLACGTFSIGSSVVRLFSLCGELDDPGGATISKTAFVDLPVATCGSFSAWASGIICPVLSAAAGIDSIASLDSVENAEIRRSDKVNKGGRGTGSEKLMFRAIMDSSRISSAPSSVDAGCSAVGEVGCETITPPTESVDDERPPSSETSSSVDTRC